MKHPSNTDNKIKIIPLGGLGYIGKNITLFEYKNEIIIVDCGIMFPNDEAPGIDFIIPDFSYIISNKSRIKAIVITHGHEDHIGAIPYLLQEISAPIYATKLTIGLIQSRLSEKTPKEPPVFHEVSSRQSVKIGAFSLEFIRVNHSIIDGVAIAINTDIGTIIHTGDFKIDFTPVDGHIIDLHRFAEYGEKGVLLLMSDSTNAERPGHTRSEAVLSKKLLEIFSGSKGRIIIATFASNIHRIQQVLDVAQIYNKSVVISGMTMLKNVEIARSLGYLNFRDDLIISFEKASSLPSKKIVIIGTGSQGEPMSALSRMANGTHRNFAAQKGDTVIITASVIPGNERTVNNVVNSLKKLEADVYHEHEPDIHVSGHASSEELKLMIALTKPEFFMPIHGEYKHLKAHALHAESLKVKPSKIMIGQVGDVLELSRKNFKKAGTVQLSEIYVDGTEIGDVESTVIKDRQAMSTEGYVGISVIIAEGMLVQQPTITSKGFVGVKKTKLLTSIQRDVEHHVSLLLKKNLSATEIESALSKTMKNNIFKLSKRNPLITVQVFEI